MSGCARWSEDVVPQVGQPEPYDVEAARKQRPRQVTTWPKTGTVGAFTTMDVGDHTSLNPTPDPRALYRALISARVKYAAFKEEVRSLNELANGSRKPDNSKAGSNLEELGEGGGGAPNELPLPPNLGAWNRPGWLASAIRNIGRRRTP